MFLKMITNKEKKLLYDKINLLSKTEHEEIYKIINLESTIRFSRNRNGVFFNLSEINEELYEKLDNFVDFCLTNKKYLDDYDKKINECKVSNNYNIFNISTEGCVDQESEKLNEDWNGMLSDPKSVQRITSYIEKLVADKDNTGKKKLNIKFNNAKKKFSKRVILDKKIDSEGIVLIEECYPL